MQHVNTIYCRTDEMRRGDLVLYHDRSDVIDNTCRPAANTGVPAAIVAEIGPWEELPPSTSGQPRRQAMVRFHNGGQFWMRNYEAVLIARPVGE